MSTVIQVLKKNNYSQLRLLFPNIQFFSEDLPAFGKQVFLSKESIYASYRAYLESANLVLVNCDSGYNLDTQGGLAVFLDAVDYFDGSKSKLKRFKDREYSGPYSVYQMYKDVSMLRVANRMSSQEDSQIGYIIDLMEKSFSDRMVAIEGMDSNLVLKSVLGYIDKFYDRTSNLKPFVYSRLSRALSTFRRDAFKKSFELTGDSYRDLQLLMTYF